MHKMRAPIDGTGADAGAWGASKAMEEACLGADQDDHLVKEYRVP